MLGLKLIHVSKGVNDVYTVHTGLGNDLLSDDTMRSPNSTLTHGSQVTSKHI